MKRVWDAIRTIVGVSLAILFAISLNVLFVGVLLTLAYIIIPSGVSYLIFWLGKVLSAAFGAYLESGGYPQGWLAVTRQIEVMAINVALLYFSFVGILNVAKSEKADKNSLIKIFALTWLCLNSIYLSYDGQAYSVLSYYISKRLQISFVGTIALVVVLGFVSKYCWWRLYELQETNRNDYKGFLLRFNIAFLAGLSTLLAFVLIGVLGV